MNLSWEMISAILEFLPRESWRGLALSCKRFRVDLALMALREERVVFPGSESPGNWKLHFLTLESFKMLNRHWRLGPLFQPVDRVTFSFPYDDDERARCLQLALDFFRSLDPGAQHIKHVYFSLGFIWDRGDRPSSINYTLFRNLLREIRRSGCTGLSIMSVDIPDQAGRQEPTPDILLNFEDQHMYLESLSLETFTFSSPMILPWFMKQVTANSTIQHLKLSGTGFTAIQLDAVLCYFDLPRLESLTIGDAWLASVVELLRGSPRLSTVNFQELSSDLRVPDGMVVSLPELRFIRGNATTIRHFVPLLRDVSWDSFEEIEIDTNTRDGADGSIVHSLDVESCVQVFKLLVCRGADMGNLAISFPQLANFSSPLFEDTQEIYETMHACKFNHLRIQLRCDVESETAELLVRLRLFSRAMLV